MRSGNICPLPGCAAAHPAVTIRQEHFSTQDCSLLVCRKFFIRFFSLAAVGAFLLPATYASQNAANTRPATFPRITSYNLAKTKLNLPGDFAGKVDLLLISFKPEQLTQVNTWMTTVEGLQHTNFNFHWYQLPVSDRENFVFRWWDNSSMRSDDTDPETWPWIVPLYVDKSHFRHALQIPNERQITVLLVDKRGKVLWRSEGPITPEKRASLLAAVAAIK